MRYVDSLNKSLHSLFSENKNVLLIGEDIVDPYGGAFKVSRGLSTLYPDRVITTPISEAGIVGLGIGLALEGYLPIVEIMFGDFITLAADQIINSAVKFEQMYNRRVKVPLLVRTPMGGRRGYGPTHSQTLEAIFLSVPNLTMIAPSHLHDPGGLLRDAAVRMGGVKLFIENKSLYPLEIKAVETQASDLVRYTLINESHPYCRSIKGDIRNNSRSEALIIGYGGMAKIIEEATEELFLEDEINVSFLFVSLIKPLPLRDVLRAIGEKSKVLIVEEGVGEFGWAAELAASIFEKTRGNDVEVKRLGAKGFIIPSSRPLENKVLPQKEDIKNIIKEMVN
jgi:pyruvate/2-oxoglutarate/acetoin dehydrogenase E1 component